MRSDAPGSCAAKLMIRSTARRFPPTLPVAIIYARTGIAPYARSNCHAQSVRIWPPSSIEPWGDAEGLCLFLRAEGTGSGDGGGGEFAREFYRCASYDKAAVWKLQSHDVGDLNAAKARCA